MIAPLRVHQLAIVHARATHFSERLLCRIFRGVAACPEGCVFPPGHACQPQTRSAVATIVRSLLCWSAGDSALPRMEVANPHCGDSARRSKGT